MRKTLGRVEWKNSSTQQWEREDLEIKVRIVVNLLESLVNGLFSNVLVSRLYNIRPVSYHTYSNLYTLPLNTYLNLPYLFFESTVRVMSPLSDLRSFLLLLYWTVSRTLLMRHKITFPLPPVSVFLMSLIFYNSSELCSLRIREGASLHHPRLLNLCIDST